MITLDNILVATDFGESAARALQFGRDLAKAFGASLHVVHVFEPIHAEVLGIPLPVPGLARFQANTEAAARRHLEELAAGGRELGRRPTIDVLSSPSVARAILGYARDRRIDLVIVGSHGRGKAAQLLVGSVAEKIVRHASCPVLTIREARPDSGTVTPVPAAGS